MLEDLKNIAFAMLKLLPEVCKNIIYQFPLGWEKWLGLGLATFSSPFTNAFPTPPLTNNRLVQDLLSSFFVPTVTFGTSYIMQRLSQCSQDNHSTSAEKQQAANYTQALKYGSLVFFSIASAFTIGCKYGSSNSR